MMSVCKHWQYGNLECGYCQRYFGIQNSWQWSLSDQGAWWGSLLPPLPQWSSTQYRRAWRGNRSQRGGTNCALDMGANFIPSCQCPTQRNDGESYMLIVAGDWNARLGSTAYPGPGGLPVSSTRFQYTYVWATQPCDMVLQRLAHREPNRPHANAVLLGLRRDLLSGLQW